MADNRVALVHFTGPPAIGGIEALLAAQARILTDLGWKVRLIVGKGQPVDNVELCVVPGLLPGRSQDPWTMQQELREELRDVSQCWVHNAVSVALHPSLTEALWLLIQDRKDIRWVIWVEDLSETSSFLLPAQQFAITRSPASLPGLTFVTISEARRAEVARWAGMSVEQVQVISPPVDVADYLPIDSILGDRRSMSHLIDREPIVLVPSKALPHKNLDVVVDIALELRSLCPRSYVMMTAAPSPHEPKRSEELVRTLRRRISRTGLTDSVEICWKPATDPMTASQVRTAMALADVILLPSREEGFGLPILEAALYRVPILCSDIPAHRFAGEDGANYFSLEESPASIARRVFDLAGTPESRLRRRALASMTAFRCALQELLEGGAPASSSQGEAGARFQPKV